MTKSKKLGGLGVKKLLIQNVALLCKWWWRYGVEKDSIWVKAINGKYGISVSKWLPSQLNSPVKFSSMWGDICEIGSGDSAFGNLIAEGFWIKVGSGLSTSFWHDTWCGNQPLRYDFPSLYLLSEQKNSMVGDIYNYSNLSWNLIFRRRLRDWESEMEVKLKLRLSSIVLHPNVEDSLRWKWDCKSSFYSVKSCYEKWELEFNPQNFIGPLCKLIWKNICPFKVEVFLWQALQDQINCHWF